MVLLSTISLLGSLTILAEAAGANFPDQGPRTVSVVNGKGVWELGGVPYKVRDYGALMATIVYNCAYMPAICKNVKNHSGSLPVAETGTDDNGNPIIDKNRLAEKTTVVKIVNGQAVQRTQWRALNAAMTCDEFPAATWIEGGAGPGRSATTTYCAPAGSSCDSSQSTLWSDQDWQGQIHGHLRVWYDRLSKADRGALAARPRDFKIFKFTNSGQSTMRAHSSPDGSSRTQKRSCFGPGFYKSGEAGGLYPGAVLLLGDPDPDNS
ncbi:hypothetical protein VTK56DRAFT_8894 [Thermocarpiscus australiensis]